MKMRLRARTALTLLGPTGATDAAVLVPVGSLDAVIAREAQAVARCMAAGRQIAEARQLATEVAGLLAQVASRCAASSDPDIQDLARDLDRVILEHRQRQLG